MVTTALLLLLTAFLNGMYAILPDWNIDLTMIGGMSSDIPDLQYTITENRSPFIMILSWMAKYNNFVPFDHVVAIMSIAVTFYAAVLGYRGIKWAIGVFRGAGTT